MIDVDRFVPFITEHKLKENQFLLLHLLYLKRFDLIQYYKKNSPHKKGEFLSLVDKTDLIKRGFIIVDDDDNWVLADKFTNIFIDDYQAATELAELYPAYAMDKEGKKYPIGFLDISVVKANYCKKIHHNAAEHKEVIKDMKYAIANDMLLYGLERFLTSNAWVKIRPLRLASEAGEVFSTKRFKF